MQDHILLYLACEQMVIGIRQLPTKDWVRQPKREWCTRGRQLMNELCMRVRHLLIEDLCLGVRHLPLEDLCIAVRQLQLGDMNWS